MEQGSNLPSLLGYDAQFRALQILLYKDLIINATDLRVLGIHLMNNGPDWRVRQHRHSFFEFHYVTENDVYTTIANLEYRIPAGHFYLIPPGAYHAHRQEPGPGHVGFALRWEFIPEAPQLSRAQNTSTDLSEIAAVLQKASSRPICDTGQAVLHGMLTVLTMAHQNRRLIELQLRLCQLILEIAAFYRAPLPSQQANSAFLENQIVKNALQFIDDNFTQAIQAPDISHAVHVSYSQLARLFKKHTGVTLTGHLNRIRLSQAQLLLKCSAKSIGQIAHEVGYNSEYYFCSLFKKHFGISPLRYRLSQERLSE